MKGSLIGIVKFKDLFKLVILGIIYGEYLGIFLDLVVYFYHLII